MGYVVLPNYFCQIRGLNQSIFGPWSGSPRILCLHNFRRRLASSTNTLCPCWRALACRSRPSLWQLGHFSLQTIWQRMSWVSTHKFHLFFFHIYIYIFIFVSNPRIGAGWALICQRQASMFPQVRYSSVVCHTGRILKIACSQQLRNFLRLFQQNWCTCHTNRSYPCPESMLQHAGKGWDSSTRHRYCHHAAQKTKRNGPATSMSWNVASGRIGASSWDASKNVCGRSSCCNSEMNWKEFNGP